MSMFYCTRCHNLIDSDYVGCVEDPGVEYGLMCPDHEEHCERCDKVLTSKEDKTDKDDYMICDACFNKLTQEAI